MWSDNEAEEDLIGFSVQADLLAKSILESKILPVTIGVFGNWGSGKSTIMRMLQRQLDPQEKGNEGKKELEKIAVLYFNGWLFEGYDDAKSAILTAILVELATHQRFHQKVKNAAVTLVKRVNWMRVARLGFSHVALPAVAAYISGGLTAVPSVMSAIGNMTNAALNRTDKIEQEGQTGKSGTSSKLTEEFAKLVRQSPEPESPGDIRSFREDFENMLENGGIETLVVLIDDLDRCSPERLVDNLEAIKLFLSVKRTAFVIGADPRIVRMAIAYRYNKTMFEQARPREGGSKTDLDTIVDDYLEKVIQLPYTLPRLSRPEVETYINLLLCQNALQPAEFTKCLHACRAGRKDNSYACFRLEQVQKALDDRLPEGLQAQLGLCEGMAEAITETLAGNPRQVKRFLNAFVLRQKLAAAAGLTTIKDAVLLKLMLLEYAEFERFRELSQWAMSQEGYPEVLKRLEPGEGEPPKEKKGPAYTPPKGWEETKVAKWISLPPLLADVDLLDYFWLARDRLDSSLKDSKFISPKVREVFLGLQSDGTRPQAGEEALKLSSGDLEALHSLLGRALMRDPGAMPIHDAFYHLLQVGADSANAWASVLCQLSLNELDPNVVLNIKTILHDSPAKEKDFARFIEKLKKSPTTPAGKAWLAN